MNINKVRNIVAMIEVFLPENVVILVDGATSNSGYGEIKPDSEVVIASVEWYGSRCVISGCEDFDIVSKGKNLNV